MTPEVATIKGFINNIDVVKLILYRYNIQLTIQIATQIRKFFFLKHSCKSIVQKYPPIQKSAYDK